MTGLVTAIYSSFFMAISQGALKKSYKDFPPSVAFFIDMVLALFIWTTLALFLGVNFNNLSTVSIYVIISAVLGEALFFYALSKGQLSITAILIGSYPIYTILFSYFLNHERLLPVQIIFIVITILGTLLTYLPSKLNLKELKKSGAIVWPILAAVGIGFSDTLSKGVIDKTGDYSFLFALAIVQVPVAFIYLKLEKEKVSKILKRVSKDTWSYKDAIAGSLFNVLGTGFMWLSFSKLLASIASPVVATSGALVVLLAVIFMDEKINFRSAAGLALVFTGIIGISTQV